MPDIATTTNDANGVQRIKSNTILFAKFVDISISSFANPGSSFYGYASDGFYREAGVAVTSPATGQPSKASWASEAEHTTATSDRNLEDSFPQKIFVVLTSSDLVILNASTLTVWMRFDLSAAAALNDYYFLGGASTALVDADFTEGVLSVLVSDSSIAAVNGVLIVDFRRDEMLRATGNDLSTSGFKSTKSISERNGAGVWQSPSSVSSFALVERSGNNISTLTSSNQTYIAVSHDSGISLLKLKPGSSGYAVAAESRQLFQKSYSSTNYQAVDDGDGDLLTPIFRADNNAEWISDGVRKGDLLVISGTRYEIASVGSDLSLVDEINVSLSVTGGSYQIVRPVQRLLLHTLESLIYVNGHGFLTQQQDQTYQGTPNNIDPWETPDYTSAVPSSLVEALCIRGNGVYVASDVGVHLVELTDTSSGLPSSYEYSSSSSDGAYKILSDDRVTALSVDPESGHLILATRGSTSSEVIDLDVDNLHQVVKRTTSDQLIKTVASYKNPDGPPAVSVS